jgi:AraC family transcriptional regulator
MPRGFGSLTAPGQTQRDFTREERFSWKSGSVLLRTLRTQERGAESVRSEISIGIVTFADAGSHLSWHIDDRPALSKTWRVASKSRDLVLLPPGCKIRDCFKGSGQGLWMHLDPETITDNKYLRAFADHPVMDASWNRDILSRTLVSELRKECLEGFPRGAMFVEQLATAFTSQLAYLLDNAPRPSSNAVRALDNAKLRKVVDYLAVNLDRNVTLSELSALVDLKPAQFCAAFRQATGRRPHQFQIDQRVEWAKTLLRNSDQSLTDIALTVGFSSQSHLHTFFSRITGTTPARFRHDLRGSSGRDILHHDACREGCK